MRVSALRHPMECARNILVARNNHAIIVARTSRSAITLRRRRRTTTRRSGGDGIFRRSRVRTTSRRLARRLAKVNSALFTRAAHTTRRDGVGRTALKTRRYGSSAVASMNNGPVRRGAPIITIITISVFFSARFFSPVYRKVGKKSSRY